MENTGNTENRTRLGINRIQPNYPCPVRTTSPFLCRMCSPLFSFKCDCNNIFHNLNWSTASAAVLRENGTIIQVVLEGEIQACNRAGAPGKHNTSGWWGRDQHLGWTKRYTGGENNRKIPIIMIIRMALIMNKEKGCRNITTASKNGPRKIDNSHTTLK